MSLRLNRLRDVHEIHAEDATEPNCPICLMSLNTEPNAQDDEQYTQQYIEQYMISNDDSAENHDHVEGEQEVKNEQGDGEEEQNGEKTNTEEVNKVVNWCHGFCRNVFHATCLETWLERACSCPLCRQCLRFHDHHNAVEPLDETARRLGIAMVQLTREQQNSSNRWSRYWQQRREHYRELGANNFHQPGYEAQQQFRMSVVRARMAHLSSIESILQESRERNIANSTDQNTSLVQLPQELASTEDAVALNTPEMEQQHQRAESIARWNLFAARNAAEEAASMQFEAALSEATTRFQTLVREARMELQRTQDADPRKDEWYESPPDPF